MSEKRTYTAPRIEEEARPYWDGAANGKLMVNYCNACGAPHHYPRPICPHCGSDKTEFREASGKGRIYSFSVMRTVPDPYAIAYVTLEGTDISMMTNIVNCDFDALHIGQEVKVAFAETEGDGPSVPVFEPA